MAAVAFWTAVAIFDNRVGDGASIDGIAVVAAMQQELRIVNDGNNSVVSFVSVGDIKNGERIGSFGWPIKRRAPCFGCSLCPTA